MNWRRIGFTRRDEVDQNLPERRSIPVARENSNETESQWSALRCVEDTRIESSRILWNPFMECLPTGVRLKEWHDLLPSGSSVVELECSTGGERDVEMASIAANGRIAERD